jgi:hypothetical protein
LKEINICMAIQFPNTSISEVGNGFLSIPGTYVQMIDGVITNTFTTTTRGSWIQLGTASITLTNPNNSLYIYYNTNFRKDQAQGNWSLALIGLFYNNSGNVLSHSGWNGSWRHTINSFRKFFIHTPGTVGPHTYSIRLLNHDAGTSPTFSANTGTASDQLSYLRLMEVAV